MVETSSQDRELVAETKAAAARGMIDLARIAREVTREVELDRVLQVITEQAVELGAVSSWLYRVRPEDHTLVRVAGWMLPEELLEQTEVLSLHDPALLVSRAARSGEIEVVEDLESLDPPFVMARKWILAPGGKSMVVAPLVARGRSVGVVAWVFAGSRELSDEERTAYRIMGEYFGLAIANAEQHRQLNEEIEERRRGERERERLLAAVEKERTWLRFMIERSPVAVVMMRPGGQILSNSEAEKLLGRPIDPNGGLEQFAGEVRLPSGKVLGESLPLTWNASTTPLLVNSEVTLLREDGQEVPVFGTIGYVRDDQGKLVGGVGILQDMRPLKELERLREEWTSLVAHDLRQPVTVISTYASLLARQQLPDGVQHKLQHIISSTRQISRMISDLLDASLFEARHLSLDRKPTCLRSLVESVVCRLSEKMDEHEVSVHVEGESYLADVDPARIEQVIGNLLINAVKYSYPASEIQLRLRFRPDEIEFSCSNRGQGIPKEKQATVFQRFQRFSQADEPLGKDSVGLGLYIAKGLVEAHGGRIWVESVPHATTTFHFVLPKEPPANAGGQEPSGSQTGGA